MSFNAAVTAFLNIKDGIASNQLDYFKFDFNLASEKEVLALVGGNASGRVQR